MEENINEFYKKKITEMVTACDNERWLRAIYTFIKNLLTQKKAKGLRIALGFSLFFLALICD